jgi:hypothetical protein
MSYFLIWAATKNQTVLTCATVLICDGIAQYSLQPDARPMGAAVGTQVRQVDAMPVDGHVVLFAMH